MGLTGSALVDIFSMTEIERSIQMIRKTIALVALIALTACSTPDVVPAKDCPRQGGIGGTGDCTTEQEVP
ncbi:hypothetical protein So717_36780 [Roseobacter cerasinus]|uniref:Lipoprotein n=1 Tax=Roseobacter cerasinus TaxID=2602289 RepID=A0A640VYA7_9RHOB|nr:hypothetical protein So717_36780 [Roseobacter cerasinus]